MSAPEQSSGCTGNGSAAFFAIGDLRRPQTPAPGLTPAQTRARGQALMDSNSARAGLYAPRRLSARRKGKWSARVPAVWFSVGRRLPPHTPPARGRTLWTPMPLTLRALPNHAACLRPALVDSALPKFASHPTISTSCTRQPVSRCSTSCRSALGQHALSCPTALQTIQQQKSQPAR